MDLRTLPPGLDAQERCTERRQRVEQELGIVLPHLTAHTDVIGSADERNCEQMIGCVSVPIGYAGPLLVTFSSGETCNVHLPLATTEAALVASVNRGCKALSAVGVKTSSIHRGMTRSLAFRIPSSGEEFSEWLRNNEKEWTQEAEGTSAHLKVLGFDIDVSAPFVFLTLRCDTDEAMGMNMVTIAAEACGQWIEARAKDCEAHFVTVAGNVDSDKKPSVRTKEKGRGYSACAETFLDAKTIEEVLKSNASDMAEVATAKLEAGSTIAGALGRNLHVANIVAALLIATGQDAAHTVEGSLADTTVTREGDGLRVHVDLPALLLGVRGGGISLPSQSDCLTLLLHPKASLKPQAQLAESFAAAVLAGEVSLLAAQASHTLASAHKKLARKRQ